MRNHNKRVKGLLTRRLTGQEDEHDKAAIKSPYLRALENPDVLSDESRMYPERDFDAEALREQHLAPYAKALLKLTPHQREVVEAVARVTDQQKENVDKKDELGIQEQVAKELGITRGSVCNALARARKKILKSANKMQK